MAHRRGATGLSGILPLDKPAGMTSHDVVAAVRRATGEGRVGHAGTLDPMATGVLVILVGRYTRLEPFLSAAWKSYDARIAFGTATDTDDAEGEAIDAAPVPDEVFDPMHAQSVLDSFLGSSMQVPPAYSAIKVGGRVSHRAARSGDKLPMEPRPIEVTDAQLLRLDADARTWDVRFRVSKGTYVRSLARDIGVAVGTLAHLGALRRTAAGLLTLDETRDLDEALAALSAGHAEALFVSPVPVLGLPAVAADPDTVSDGRAVPVDDPGCGPAADLPEGALACVTVDGALHGVYRREGGRLRPVAIVGGDPS